ncbi:MAG TPA: CapA family protein, partial [Acidimicrobiales bacterium]|nr:CapA family protein [Acidimicrobiales bacterium]
CPSPSQRSLARALVAAGADIVVGGHAHRLQGAGRMEGGLVAYGLGNFLFQATSPDAARTGVLEVTVTGRRVDGYRWVPGRISGGVPAPVTGADAAAELASWEALRGCTELVP